MTTSFEELTAPSRDLTTWKVSRADLLEDSATEDIIDDSRGNLTVRNSLSLEPTLLKLVSELIGGVPGLAEVQALCVWPYQPEDREVQTDWLTASFTKKMGSCGELPLDDSIVRWVWHHQRPLVISAQTETRFPDFAQQLLEWNISYFCAVPLMLANRRIGILGLASAKREALSGFDGEFIQRGVSRVASVSRNNGTFKSPLKSSASEPIYLEEDISSEIDFEGIIGRSAVMRALCKQVKVVAPTGSTALILGETGTGKELIARAIHNLSPRRDRPFIKVNCAAIPAGLIESELFGHERGAFTGAIERRIGRFERANGGTLFLDEIGDIPLELQSKLLRVLQEQEFERIGSTQTIRVNVRIVAATSRELPRMVAEREFRPDLYYRLNVFPLRVPALRERREDIPLLIRHFVEFYSAKTNKHVTDVPVDTMEVFSRYGWPGNVRELQNVVERAVILSPGKVLRPPLDELQQSTRLAEAAEINKSDDLTTFKDVQREHIIRALAVTNWVLGGPKGAAARLGLARTTLIAKMHKLGISRAEA